MLFGSSNDVGNWLFDADVNHLVAIVGQDDVNKVLSDVMHISANRGQHNCALASLVGFLHVWLEQSNGGLHNLGRLQHEGQLHLALTKAFSNHLHALKQVIVDDGEWSNPICTSKI